MPVEFYELPQGTPSIAAVDGIAGLLVTGYCTASDAVSLNRARGVALGAGNNPTLTDLNGYIMMIAGEIDGVLLSKGWQTPVNVASYPQVERLLARVNAAGAAWMLESSSPAPQATEVDRLKDAYDASLKLIEDGKISLDIDMETARSEARGPWITMQPAGETFDPMIAAGNLAGGDGITGGPGAPGVVGGFGGNPANPYFTRSMRF